MHSAAIANASAAAPPAATPAQPQQQQSSVKNAENAVVVRAPVAPTTPTSPVTNTSLLFQRYAVFGSVAFVMGMFGALLYRYPAIRRRIVSPFVQLFNLAFASTRR